MAEERSSSKASSESAEEQRQLLNAVYSVSFAAQILERLGVDGGIEFLQDEARKRRILPSDLEEPLFVYRVVETGHPLQPHSFVALVPLVTAPRIGPREDRFVSDDTIAFKAESGKSRAAGLQPAEAGIEEHLEGALQSLGEGDRVDPEGFVIYDYPPGAALQNRAILHFVELDGQRLLLGASYTPEKIREDQQPGWRFFLILGAYLAAWAAITWLFARNESMAVPIFVGGLGAALLFVQQAAQGGIRAEVSLSGTLRNASIVVAAAALGISLFLRRVQRKVIVSLVLVGFFLAIIPLALSGVSFKRGTLPVVNSAVVVLLSLSVSCILTVLLLTLPSFAPDSALVDPEAHRQQKTARPVHAKNIESRSRKTSDKPSAKVSTDSFM